MILERKLPLFHLGCLPFDDELLVDRDLVPGRKESVSDHAGVEIARVFKDDPDAILKTWRNGSNLIALGVKKRPGRAEDANKDGYLFHRIKP